MLTVETIGRIRREHFLKGKTIKEIVRDLRVSRNTVRKVLRSGETSFAYERTIQPRPKLGRWTAELDDLLSGNAAKPSREQLTLIRIFEELRGRGYDGGYDAVRRYARRWSKAHGQSTAVAYVPLSFAPGEAYQFDWSHEVILLSGVTVTVKVAHVRLCHSRMPFVRAYRYLRRSSMTAAASRSAVPVACVSAASTARALRFSISTCPMKHSRLSRPSALR
jgi:transposase